MSIVVRSLTSNTVFSVSEVFILICRLFLFNQVNLIFPVIIIVEYGNYFETVNGNLDFMVTIIYHYHFFSLL